MSHSNLLDPKNTLNLIGLKKQFTFLKKLHDKKKFPKVLLISGDKGLGKFTLVNHLLCYIFDRQNYDNVNNIISENSSYLKKIKQKTFLNLIHLDGDNHQSIKIDDIRNLKDNLSQSSFDDQKRFIILDNIDSFNKNSLNALLKTIEEPNESNFFILIYNKSKPILETIKSRCFEFKLILSEKEINQITKDLLKRENIEPIIKFDYIKTTPGNFLKFNSKLKELNIDLSNKFITNLKILILSFKKEKDFLLVELIYFYVNYYFQNLQKFKNDDFEKIFQKRSFVIKEIKDFFELNLNQNALFNVIENRINE